MPRKREPLISAFTVVIDTREQSPYAFESIRGDANDGYRPIQVLRRMGTLKQGDYSIDGLERQIAVERKSLPDLFGTLSQGRDRFIAELARLAGLEFSAVVVEADWATILNDPPRFSQLCPKTVYRSVIAWQQRFPTVHWWTCPDRAFAEVTTYRILERYWIDFQKRRQALSNAAQRWAVQPQK